MDETTSIERAFRRMSRASHLSRVHERLNAMAGVTLDRPAYITLACLADEGPRTVTGLAEISGVEVSTMSRLVDRLTADGLIEKRRGPTDGRVVMLSLTEAGMALARRLREVRHAALQQALADWSVADRRQFAQLLDRFVDALEAIATAPPVTEPATARGADIA